ncbi:beta-propeller domain-containing protein [Caulobacter sp. NIBR1757]|uniref:beta-propeller domain-containing protein n=1 Tax=Caulobacter sp. NIBR1757 TaxID=3016000 RepID=UPI0022F11849|nr:beta-propeller domain-containing protein [Caulobacter sp. NIBR1757]WGM37508.1 hypothetical protein AMEJIAPC_00406 [Caulobacter sp. NIBR1757]
MDDAAKRTLAVLLSLAATVGVIAALAVLTPRQAQAGATMAAFGSDKALAAFLDEQKRAEEAVYEDEKLDSQMVMSETTSAAAGPADAPASPAKVSGNGEAMAAPQQPADRITNTQEADIDEGGIVKARGDLLIILRRGRLFTVSTAGGGMRPVSRIDAFPPGAEPDAWYDEMLVAGDRVAVVGYSYARGGTEINRFRLSPDGRLSFIDSHALHSSDYYSSRNYASRLVGNKLIFYSAMSAGSRQDPLAALPALRQWTPGAKQGAFRRIASGRRVYAPPQVRANKAAASMVHSITTCDLAAERFDCQATAVLGPPARTFYVARGGVYLWVHDQTWSRRKAIPDMLYRMPLDGGAPTAIEVSGAPIDQFSFREAAEGRLLHVLVARDGEGDGMWSAERGKSRSVALLTLPLDQLDDGHAIAGPRLYRTLDSPGQGWALHNRFVGDHLLYGMGADWEERDGDNGLLLVAPLDGGPVVRVTLPHSVDRIELMGPDAVVVGSGSDAVWFSTILLRGRAQAGDRYRLGGAAEAESRSHGFFYRPDNADGTQGVLGLPVSRAARPAYYQLFESSAAMLFLRRAEDRFQPLGQLAASDEGIADDGCLASCVDWYGNARPIFLRGRVFALLGYELVEGDVRGPAIREVGRISFAPPPVTVPRP